MVSLVTVVLIITVNNVKALDRRIKTRREILSCRSHPVPFNPTRPTRRRAGKYIRLSTCVMHFVEGVYEIVFEFCCDPSHALLEQATC